MPDGMQTQTGLMIKTARDVNGVADSLTSMLNSLMNELAPLQSAWVGQGGLSFQGVKQRIDDDIARLNAALRSIAEAVATSGRDYAVSDEEMRSEMSHAGATAGQITSALKMN
jgi:WXG100 family type VII secretion target